MSRIGSLPITVPSGVTVDQKGQQFIFRGPKGELSVDVHPRMKVVMEDNTITIERPTDNPQDRSLHGLTRTLLNNQIVGVTEGYSKKLELQGVGFRAQAQGKKLTLNIGFSHPVIVEAPEGIDFAVDKDNIITISGIDKQLVGHIAANIRSQYPPEPYKGKGIRYEGERVVRKEGKRVAASA